VGAYAIVAWLVAQIVNVVNEPLRLPDWFDTAIIVLLLAAFPFVLLFAWIYELAPGGQIVRTTDLPAVDAAAAPRLRRPSVGYVAAGVAAGALLASAAVWTLAYDGDAAWARDEAIPQIEASIDKGEYEAAYALAMEVARRAPDNDQLAELWTRFSSGVSIPSEPPGARVFRRGYDSTDAEWLELGVTPIANVRVPHGLSRLRFELEGYLPLERTLMGALPVQRGERRVDLVSDASQSVGVPRPFVLDTAETLPEGKVRVAGWQEEIDGERVDFEDFFLGRTEVTNREYKAFIDAGGYRDRRYWQHPIIDRGVERAWSEAVAGFTDRTGRPGPSTWAGGDYPDGQDDYPVSGVSWYEAAAFAAFRQQELPTVHHWRRAVDTSQQAWVLPKSNLESTGPVAVGSRPAMTWPGAYDMGGNVREWLFNELGGQRFILGGGWNDQTWVAMTFHATQPALDRSPTNGFRLAITRDPPAVIAKARRPQSQQPERDLSSVPSPSDEVFGVFRSVHAYDKTPLNVVAEATVESRNWIRERIVFDAAYGGERMGVYLYLPRVASPPYQTVVYMPGADGWYAPTIDHLSFHLDFVAKSGRAVAVPIYQNMFERSQGPPPFGNGLPTTRARDFAVQVHKDFRRTLDYLETRRDIDVEAFALYGLSIGGRLAIPVLALEPRLKAAMLTVTGVGPDNSYLPEVDPMNYLSRITLPVLMLNSNLDNLVPLEEDAKPVFMRLGTPPERKRQRIEPGGHFVPQEVLIRETLDWLDTYLGAVKRGS
jgi:formylglycine-generating enzyme required for sulfatase activity/dienelactone hydrolase